jgi:pentatricopeptide repeat protein
METCGFQPDVDFYCALITGFLHAGELQKVLALFQALLVLKIHPPPRVLDDLSGKIAAVSLCIPLWVFPPLT